MPSIIIHLWPSGVLHIIRYAGPSEHLPSPDLTASAGSGEARVAIPLCSVVPKDGAVLPGGHSWDAVVYILIVSWFQQQDLEIEW